MFFDLINWGKLKHGALYAIYMLIVLTVQHLALAHVPILGVRPMIVPAAIIAVGLFEGGVWGGVFGLFCGLICDMIFIENTIMFTALFPIIGFFSGVLADYVVNRRFFSYFFLALAALLITAAIQMFRIALLTEGGIVPLLAVAGLQVLWSLPFTPLTYFPCRALGRARPDR